MGGAYSAEDRRMQEFAGETCVKEATWKAGHRSEDDVNLDLQEWDVGVWTGSNWFRTETGGEHL